MLRIASVFIAALAAIGPVVQAASTCTPGLDYCGFTLERNGWSSGSPIDGLVSHELYHCVFSGGVAPIRYCDNKCRDGGNGKSDYCQK
ncbi:hypothetical protein E4U09_001429 [Claviceps aff. purpurea]|uniref:Uncharacterized protein n=1 Tax=Claviceps aff. purpurea TaxID=1967640 RepID=A0A9P7U1U6_9HYPO|nr:hypothetical protein E4U09_001429 [Claviceps aff. purpurea]